MHRALALLSLLTAAACGSASPESNTGGLSSQRHLTGEVADLMERRCTSCHADTLAGPGGISSREFATTHGLLTLEESMRFHRWMAGSQEPGVCSWGQQPTSAAAPEPAGTRDFLRPGLGCTACPFLRKVPRLEVPQQQVAPGSLAKSI
ncbi:MAG: hypothetical protein QM765_36595 [Myxococcales bacterium]